MNASQWVELVVCAVPFIGIPLVCYFDPAGFVQAELNKRNAQQEGDAS